MFEIDHGRQDLLSTCALLLVIERLLVAEIGEVAADCAAKPLNSPTDPRNVGCAPPAMSTMARRV